MKMTRWFLPGIAIFLAGLPVLAAESHPNVIVILTDDQGYADVGFNGCKDIPTPNIDRIASEGVRFTSGYVTYSVCGPSRAGFITGRYPQRFGFERNPQYTTSDPHMGVPLTEDTFADILGRVGYTSGVVGKWHLGAHPDLHPLNRGFDFFFGHLGGGHRYFPEEWTIRDSHEAKDEAESYRTWIMKNREPVKVDQYLTDAFSDAALEFVRTQKDGPFFLYLAYNAPHGPLQATEKYLSRFPDIEDPKRKTYAAMVSAVDDGVGRLLKLLDELGIAENTLVFFLSDNGGSPHNASNNAPLRGHKSNIWEGGFRVPFALRWPAKIEGGRDYDKPVSSLDILGTMVGLTGAKVAAERPLDGVNLVPYLLGKNEGSPHSSIYLRKWDAKDYAIRHGDMKLLIHGAENKTELYDLSDDIGERHDLAKSKPEQVSELDGLLREWESGLIEPQFLGLRQAKGGKKGKSKK